MPEPVTLDDLIHNTNLLRADLNSLDQNYSDLLEGADRNTEINSDVYTVVAGMASLEHLLNTRKFHDGSDEASAETLDAEAAVVKVWAEATQSVRAGQGVSTEIIDRYNAAVRNYAEGYQGRSLTYPHERVGRAINDLPGFLDGEATEFYSNSVDTISALGKREKHNTVNARGSQGANFGVVRGEHRVTHHTHRREEHPGADSSTVSYGNIDTQGATGYVPPGTRVQGDVTQVFSADDQVRTTVTPHSPTPGTPHHSPTRSPGHHARRRPHGPR